MSTVSTKQITQALGSLSQKELQDIADKASFMLHTGTASAEITDDEKLAHDVISSIIQRTDDASIIPLPVLRKRCSHYKDFRHGVSVFFKFIDEHANPGSKTGRRAAAVVLMKMLARRLSRDNTPVKHKTMSTALVRVAEITDQQFPGYLESGLLKAVICGKSLRLAV